MGKGTEHILIHFELLENLIENNPFALHEAPSNFDSFTLQSGLL